MQEQAYLQAVHEEEEASCSWVLEAADTYCANRLTVGSGMSAEQCGEAVLRQSPTPYPATDPVSRQVVMQVRPPRLPNPTLRHTHPECSLRSLCCCLPVLGTACCSLCPHPGRAEPRGRRGPGQTRRRARHLQTGGPPTRTHHPHHPPPTTRPPVGPMGGLGGGWWVVRSGRKIRSDRTDRCATLVPHT